MPELLPAVDILDGRAVRLVQGDFERSTEYAADPVDAAKRWVSEGARRLHVVDLDGARAGKPVNLETLERIAADAGVPVQYGGGLRSPAGALAALGAGAARVVIGTAAFEDPEMLEPLLEREPDRVAVAVDVRSGRIATAGWAERTELEPADVTARLAELGVRCFVYTDIDRDGTLEGVEHDEFVRVARAAGNAAVVYSGGIGALDDLRPLAALGLENLEGVIVGKALYEGRFTVAEGREALGAGEAGSPGAEGAR
jgi:phosphoribosylformimino-5-aminoimidazole carboxamide ribotide isomerase